MGNAINDTPAIGRKLGTQTIPARINIRPEIGGKMFDTTWLLNEGEVYKVFAKGRMGGHLARERTAILFIKLRDDGPLTRIKATMPNVCPDANFSEWTITGRFDILSLEEAEFEGINIIEHLRGQAAEHSVRNMFTVEQMEQERRSRPKIVMKRVGDRIMPVQRRRRSLDI